MPVPVEIALLRLIRVDLTGDQALLSCPFVEVIRVGDVPERPYEQLPLGVAEHFTKSRVHLQIASLECDQRHADGRTLEGAEKLLLAGAQLFRQLTLPEVQAHPRQQLRTGEGTGDVAIRSGIETFRLVLRLGLRAQQHHRYCRQSGIRTDLPQDLRPGKVRHDDIQEDEKRSVESDLGKSRDTVGRLENLIAFLFKNSHGCL